MSDISELIAQPIAGIDEAGRGPLAGPVVAAAVILNPEIPITGITDSKKLTPRRRELLFDEICESALSWCIELASVEEIDELNILHASMLAMSRSVAGLSVTPSKVLVDGNRCPDIDCPAEAIVGGDLLIAEIGAASILAKVTRDRMMVNYDVDYPHYGFAQHKGYPTKKHREALAEFGPCEIHRRSFAPVAKYLSS